jgi:hypothetical protein
MNFRRSATLSISLFVAAVLFLAPAARAQSLPSVNLGLTSFLDGGPPAGPGFYYQQYLQFFTSDKLTNNDGDDGGAIEDLDVWASLNQFIYQSDYPLLLGGKWGVDVIVPIVGIDVDPATGSPLTDNGAGLGDIVIGPFLQWDPIMGENGPIFVHRVEFQCIVPTGKYDNDEVLNPGAGHFSFNPYWAGTLWMQPRWSASVRAHYLWNDENDDPWVGLGASDVQPGQAIHVNFATAYEVLPKQLHVGFNGYYLKQITDAKINGADAGSREQVLGIGPGAVWHFSQDDHLFFNAYFETLGRNRPEGMRFLLRWTHHF